jgi:hypothetical protein
MRALAIAASFALCGVLLGPHAAGAQTPEALTTANAPPTAARGVVELYTSQGCSSCPKADAVLSKLSERNDLITISWGIDYWDYLGWRDTAARPEFTERQKAYAKALGNGMVYTPQAVINGAAHANGGDEAKIERAIERVSKAFAAARVPVRLSTADGKLVIEIDAARQGVAVKEATVWLAPIAHRVEVPITRGENSGKTIVYSNVARRLIPVGTWNGKSMTVRLDRRSFMPEDADRVAVLVQQGHGGPIIGAALLPQF